MTLYDEFFFKVNQNRLDGYILLNPLKPLKHIKRW